MASTLTLDQYTRELDGWADADAALAKRALRRAAYMAQGQVQREIVGNHPYPVVNHGTLAKASSWPVTEIANGYKLESVVPYAATQEYGTKPFWAPLAPLLDWARAKMRGKTMPARQYGPRVQLGPPARSKPTLGLQYKSGTKAMRRRGREQAAQSFARAVQHTIARRGIKPKGYYAAASKHFGGFVKVALMIELKARR